MSLVRNSFVQACDTVAIGVAVVYLSWVCAVIIGTSVYRIICLRILVSYLHPSLWDRRVWWVQLRKAFFMTYNCPSFTGCHLQSEVDELLSGSVFQMIIPCFITDVGVCLLLKCLVQGGKKMIDISTQFITDQGISFFIHRNLLAFQNNLHLSMHYEGNICYSIMTWSEAGLLCKCTFFTSSQRLLSAYKCMF